MCHLDTRQPSTLLPPPNSSLGAPKIIHNRPNQCLASSRLQPGNATALNAQSRRSLTTFLARAAVVIVTVVSHPPALKRTRLGQDWSVTLNSSPIYRMKPGSWFLPTLWWAIVASQEHPEYPLEHWPATFESLRIHVAALVIGYRWKNLSRFLAKSSLDVGQGPCPEAWWRQPFHLQENGVERRFEGTVTPPFTVSVVEGNYINSQDHSRRVSRLSAALSLRSFGGLVAEGLNERINTLRKESGTPRRDVELESGVEEWTGSEDADGYVGGNGSEDDDDDESIGEWSNPSDEERARQQRAERRRRGTIESEQPRRLSKFPRPPETTAYHFMHQSAGDEDEIISNVPFYDPNQINLVAAVSISQPKRYKPTVEPIMHPTKSRPVRVLALDVGMKYNQIRCFTARGVEIKVVPWNYDLLAEKEEFDGLFISNGPVVPVFGICLGYQVDGGETLPAGWKELFVNANDGSNEGIYCTDKPFFSVQFHPESTPGPRDTEFLFGVFIDGIYVTCGRQTALNVGIKLKDEFEELGVKVLGTPIDTIVMTEDRQLFANAMAEVGERCANSSTATSIEEALAAADIGYPVIARAAYALGGLGSGFAQDEAGLKPLCGKVFATSPQVLVEKSMKGWKEIE
ncbi:Carbamoyl-phosphate synthase [Marasmius sp. AFHP31]|nr:Carbamoyl-phosphate synthase [Marasmius sp. AFHP31]